MPISSSEVNNYWRNLSKAVEMFSNQNQIPFERECCNCSNATWGGGSFWGLLVCALPDVWLTSRKGHLQPWKTGNQTAWTWWDGTEGEKNVTRAKWLERKRGRGSYLLHFEQREGRREIERPREDCPSQGGEWHVKTAVLQWQGWRIMFEGSQKELAGQSELPGQKGEDRKEEKEGASMSGYVENNKAGKAKELWLFPAKQKGVKGKRKVAKTETKWCWEWIGKVNWRKHCKETVNVHTRLREVTWVLPIRTQAA